MNRRGANRTGPLGGAGMVGLWGASSFITSVQYGSIAGFGTSNLTATATISAVDTSRAFVVWLGSNNGGVDDFSLLARVALTNSTTVTGTRERQDGANGTTVNFVVVEFLPGIIRSMQVVYGSLLSTASPTASITAVNTSKTVLLPVGRVQTYAGGAVSYTAMPTSTLTNATTVTWAAGSSGADVRIYSLVLEFN